MGNIEMMIQIIPVLIGVFCGVFLGFWMGRVSVGQNTDEEEVLVDTQPEVDEDMISGARRKAGEISIQKVGSPVSGNVIDCSEGRGAEVLIYPAVEKLYAPTEGKVIRLFPLRNEFLFRTESGVVLRMKVAVDADELQSEYFRPKVIQNDVVNKGKLLLEFDQKQLEAEGVECAVSVKVEEFYPNDRVLCMKKGPIKTGEDILEVVRKQR